MSILNIIVFFLTISIYHHAIADDVSIIDLKKYITIEQLKTSQATKHQVFVEENSSQYVLELHNASIINGGNILTQEGFTLKDLVINMRDRGANHEHSMYFKGVLAVIPSTGSENWSAWLLQVLPRLVILKESKLVFDKIYINNLKYSWQQRSLKIMMKYLDIPADKIMALSGDAIIKAKTLLVPSIPYILGKSANLPKWLPQELKEVFLQQGKSVQPTYEKIFITRAKLRHQAITNEAELTKLLEEKGFQVVMLERMSPYDQAHLFAKAKVIISANDAAFANILFATPGLKILMIHANSKQKNYESLAKFMGVEYFQYQCVKDAQEDKSVSIDINQFNLLLQKLQ